MAPWATRRGRGIAAAVGVPVAFVLAALLLAVGTPVSASIDPILPDATAMPSPAPTAPESADGLQKVHLPVTYRAKVLAPVAFITIDDGVHKDLAALRLVEARRVPVTAFLTAWTIKDYAPYFSRITHWGSIENHSATHARFTRSGTDLHHEICYTQDVLKRDFGTAPYMLRPPYGDGAAKRKVQRVADRCGIQQIVLWDAVVGNGKVSTATSIGPGSIILLHFTDHLARDLSAALQAIDDAGLTPANLADYLPAR